MRQVLLPPLAALSLVALPASVRAEEDAGTRKKKEVHCTLATEKGDRISQGRDLILERGKSIRDAVAVDGNVVIRAGSTVEDVVAIRGNVTVEPGARVKGNVVALGGDVRIGKDVRIDGNVSALGGRLELSEGATIAGDRTQFSLNLNGEELVRGFLDKALEQTETRCELRVSED